MFISTQLLCRTPGECIVSLSAEISLAEQGEGYPNYDQFGPPRVRDCRTEESTIGCLILLQLIFLIDKIHIPNLSGYGLPIPYWAQTGIP